jgi:hypothetical protein
MTNQGVKFHLPPGGQFSAAVDMEKLLRRAWPTLARDQEAINKSVRVPTWSQI